MYGFSCSGGSRQEGDRIVTGGSGLFEGVSVSGVVVTAFVADGLVT